MRATSKTYNTPVRALTLDSALEYAKRGTVYKNLEYGVLGSFGGYKVGLLHEYGVPYVQHEGVWYLLNTNNELIDFKLFELVTNAIQAVTKAFNFDYDCKGIDKRINALKSTYCKYKPLARQDIIWW